MTEAGGDPACWAGLVCPDCGRLDERAPADRDGRCPHCGAEPDGGGAATPLRDEPDLGHDLPPG
jgi:hypothetical protein